MTSNSTLLIVDDESSVCRAIVRLFGGRVKEVLTALTPAEAEAILESRPVDLIICDQRLGPGQPPGTELADRWKTTYPSIQRIIILTGTDIKQIDPPPSVHSVLPKVIDPQLLAEALDLTA